MRTIDMETWPRRQHFNLFKTFNHPIFNMCAPMDVTAFFPFIKEQGYSLTVSVVYLITRTANAIPAFRLRIRGDQVVEHQVVHPGFSILVDEDHFSFCIVNYASDYTVFAAEAQRMIAAVKAQLNLEIDPNRDDRLFMSPIPWVSFTSFTHPMQMHPGDSVPRFAWGKIYQQDQRLKMPLSVQGHHALMDGVHMGRFYEKIQGYLDQPKITLDQP